MPLVSRGDYILPYFIYHAPVNEKTKQLREKFDMDEETGYPRAYNFRNIARLGQEYKPEDPFLKFDPSDPKADKGVEIYSKILPTLLSTFCHWAHSTYYGYKWYSRPYIFGGFWISQYAVIYYYNKKTQERQNQVNAVDVDYAQQHPERFGKIYRPKLRECLFHNTYIR